MYEKLHTFTQAFTKLLALGLLIAFAFPPFSKSLGLQDASLIMVFAVLLAGSYLLQILFGKLAFNEALVAVAGVPMEDLEENFYRETQKKRRQEGKKP